MTNGHEFDQSAVYEIRVKGQLDMTWSDWFCGFEITPEEEETLLSGQSPDQSALYGLLAKLGEMGFTLLSVVRIGQPLESENARNCAGDAETAARHICSQNSCSHI